MRSLSDALKTAVARRSAPHAWMLVEFLSVLDGDGVPLRLTNFPRQIVWGAKTWNPLPGIAGKGFGETLELSAPAAALVLPSLDASLQQRFLDDEFRGTKVVVTRLAQEPGTSIADASQVWQTRYTIGPDEMTADGLTLTLESADAAVGADVPLRQVADIGCVETYMKGNCWYRGHVTYNLNHETRQPLNFRIDKFTTCSKRLYDADGKPGCHSHFPCPNDDDANDNVAGTLNPDWTLIQDPHEPHEPRWRRPPIPYSAYPGGDPNAVVL